MVNDCLTIHDVYFRYQFTHCSFNNKHVLIVYIILCQGVLFILIQQSKSIHVFMYSICANIAKQIL